MTIQTACQSQWRYSGGIYKRVAAKLGIDESFVSRVATGQRKSPRVISAIHYELTLIRDYLNRMAGKSNGA